MKNLVILLAAVAILYFFLSGRSSTCESLEDVEAKGEELQQAMVKIFESGDMDAIKAFANHQGAMQRTMNDIEANPTGGFDYQATCDAIDDLLNDL